MVQKVSLAHVMCSKIPMIAARTSMFHPWKRIQNSNAVDQFAAWGRLSRYDKTQSADFAKAAALLNAAAIYDAGYGFAQVRMEMIIQPVMKMSFVLHFQVKKGECKIAVGGVSDCCEKPTNISLSDYLDLIMAVPKLDGAVMSLSDGNVMKGHIR